MTRLLSVTLVLALALSGCVTDAMRKLQRSQALACMRQSDVAIRRTVMMDRFDQASADLAKLVACRKKFLAARGQRKHLAPLTDGYVARLESAIAHKTVPARWTYKEVVDGTDGTVTTHLDLHDPGDVDHWLPALALECHGGKPKATLRLGAFFAGLPPGQDPRRSVTEELDGARPSVVQALMEPGRRVLVLPAAKSFIQSLGNAKRLELWFSSRTVMQKLTEHATAFDVRGLKGKLGRFWSRCGAQPRANTHAKGHRRERSP